jgi:hypothetical protein
VANARQRGTGVRVRSEAKAAAADRLLLAAQDERTMYDGYTAAFNATPKWRFRRRRRLKDNRFTCAVRFMQAITAAQDVAKKGRYVDLG